MMNGTSSFHCRCRRLSGYRELFHDLYDRRCGYYYDDEESCFFIFLVSLKGLVKNFKGCETPVK